MTKLAAEHVHPDSGILFEGLRLYGGALLNESDRYASTSGTWEPNPCGTLELRCAHVLWVRPESEFSPMARSLLVQLSARGEGACLAELAPMNWHIVPGPKYRWIGGPCETYRVEGGWRAVVELIGYGFLRHESWDKFAQLTELGETAAAKLAA